MRCFMAQGNWLPACHRFPPGVSPLGATPDESEVGGRLTAIGCWHLLSHDSRLGFVSGLRCTIATVRNMKLGAALAVSVVVPARRDRPDSNGERDGMEPVATFDLPRAQIHGDGDDAVRWQGTFVSNGGHGADQSTTIVFEIEPGERLG